MIEMEIRETRVTIFPAVRGLVNDGRKIEELLRSNGFDAVGVSVSPEELAGLRYMPTQKAEHDPLGEAYTILLSNFGDVSSPPPCFSAAVDTGDRMGIPVLPLDMNDDQYTELYCELVGIRDMLRESRISKRIQRMRFDVSDARSFVYDWDRRVNSPKGFRALEMKREEHIAERIADMARLYRKVLAVVEMERSDGVVNFLTGK